MAFLAVPVAQMQTGSFGSVNCGPAATELVIKLCSVDALDIPAAKIRSASGDTSGGIEGYLLASTANKLTKGLYPLVYQRIADWQDARDLLEHRSAAIIIRCSVTIKTKFRTNSFTGNHWVTVGGGTIKDGTIKVEDPGTTVAGWARWPIQLLREASDFGGSHWLLTSPPTEDVDKTVVMASAAHSEPNRTAKVTRRLKVGDEVHVAKTVKGGPWRRADGTLGQGWHKLGDGSFLKGEAAR